MFHNYSWRHFFTIATLYLLSSSLFSAGQAADSVAPEAASGIQTQSLTHANKFMVATANPVASQAGYDVLKAGGSAIDALVAVQMTLGLVEPQSSGLGGGAFAVYYDAKEQKLTTFDGRETAPMAATPELFQDDKGEPLSFYTAVVGGRSVGTPGTVKLMGELHDKYGTLPWKDLLEPAAKIAQEGFIVSPRLAEAIKGSADHLSRYPKTKSYFFNHDGTPREAGSRMTNTAYYKTLNLLAIYGPEEFYTGQIAKDIVSQVQIIADNPGVLSEQDFANYHPTI